MRTLIVEHNSSLMAEIPFPDEDLLLKMRHIDYIALQQLYDR